MKVCYILFCFIFLTAQEDANTSRVTAETSTHRRVEGENITLECSFLIRGSRKLFCKKECEDGNILIETTDDTFQSGRYSIKYVRKGILKSDIMYVSITQLKKSDSGWYRCSLDTVWTPDYFEIIVTEASTTTQSLNFRSGSSTPSSASTELMKHSEAPAGPVSHPDFSLLLVIVIVVMLVLMLFVIVTLIYKKRAKGSAVLERRRNSDHNQTEIALYEIFSPVLTCEDSIYQSLDPASRDQDQTYSTLPYTK